MATTATAAMASLQGGTVDLTKPATFRDLTLTAEQLQKRLAILTALEEQLDTQGQPLTPKSAKELGQIVDLTSKDKGTLQTKGPFPISRLTAPYYWVEFSRTKMDFYRDVQRQIVEVPRTPVQVLQAVQPKTQAHWFQAAIFAQTQSVLSSDFMDALNATLMGNMCTLRASLLLMGNPDLFREVLSLYSSSSDLYNAQITHNRQFESELLRTTEENYRALQELHQQIVQICGATLNESPQLAQAVQAYRVTEAAVITSAQQAILAHCATFLEAINQLKARTEECVNKITDKNIKVAEALAHMTTLVEHQKALVEKQAKMQAEYEAFQSAKQKELDSRQVNDKKSQLKILFFTIYSSLKTEITQDDFGSKDAYARYIAIQQEEAVLSSAIKNSKDKFAATISGVIECGNDKNSLTISMQALATSIVCVKQLEVALQERQRQARDQIYICERILREKGRTGDPEDARVETVLALIQDGIEKTIKKQAVWLASHRQSFTLRNFLKLEQDVRAAVILALTAEGGGDMTTVVNKATRLLNAHLPANVDDPEQVQMAFLAQLIPYKRMLQLTEGTSDTDQKV